MSNAGLFLHTTINFDEVAAALDYGQRTLDQLQPMQRLTNAFKKDISLPSLDLYIHNHLLWHCTVKPSHPEPEDK